MPIRLTVNGQVHEIHAGGDATLLDSLRGDLGLTGTRYGCGHGMCGACVVLVDGAASPACMLRLADVAGARIVTIEGLEGPGEGGLHPVQRAFVDEDAMQCGYCTGGMILAAVALLNRTPHPTDEDVRSALTPHLCRCGVYGRVIRAIHRAAR